MSALFGLTYATYVGIVGASLVAFDGPAVTDAQKAQDEKLWVLTVGKNSPKKDTGAKDGIVSLEYRPQQEMWWRFKPLYAAGVSTDGIVYATAAVRKDFQLGPIQITPHFGPTLYQSKIDQRFSGSELIQFRTGFDILIPITKEVSIGGGYYHISNGNLNRKTSAELDITNISVQYKF